MPSRYISYKVALIPPFLSREATMNQPKPKKKRILEVRTSFEVSRLSPEYLASTYEQILPPVRRLTSITKQSSVININLEQKQLGKENHECS